MPLTLPFVPCCSWSVADSVSAVLEGSAGELRAWRTALLESCVKWLIASLSGGQHDLDSARDQERQMLLRFRELLVGVFPFRGGPDCTLKGKSGIDSRVHGRAPRTSGS